MFFKYSSVYLVLGACWLIFQRLFYNLIQIYSHLCQCRVLPYIGYMGMCRCEGYGFQAVYSRIGYINQRVWVQNGVSFFRKLISWLKILPRLGKQQLQDRGDLGSLLQYRVAKFSSNSNFYMYRFCMFWVHLRMTTASP